MKAMRLKILLPFRVFADVSGVVRIVAEGRDGSFGLLPRRRDCVTALAPGILTYETAEAGEMFAAVDEGVLVKTGPEVVVAVRDAIFGRDLRMLRAAVEEKFVQLNEEERVVRRALARMESSFVRGLTGFRHD